VSTPTKTNDACEASGVRSERRAKRAACEASGVHVIAAEADALRNATICDLKALKQHAGIGSIAPAGQSWMVCAAGTTQIIQDLAWRTDQWRWVTYERVIRESIHVEDLTSFSGWDAVVMRDELCRYILDELGDRSGVTSSRYAGFA
jgi:hypothetical protein